MQRTDVRRVRVSTSAVRPGVSDQRSNTRASASRAACRALGLAAALLTAGAYAGADSIRVTRRAALNGSHFGVELRVDGRGGGPARDAYVAVGPEKGLHNETSLEAGFSLDVGLESLVRKPGKAAVLPFLRFCELPAQAKVVVFLEQTRSGAWFIGARAWDDTTGALVLAGRAPLISPRGRSIRDADSGASGFVAPRLVVEWGAVPARVGYVRLMSERPDGVRTLLFEKTDLDNESQVVNQVRVGVVAGEVAAWGPYRLFLDDFETRARYCAGDAEIGAQFERIRNEVLRLPRETARLRQDVLEMRQKMHDGHPNKTALFDIKQDKGGMVDIEFMVQFLVLAHAASHPELTANSGNLALLACAADLGLIDAETSGKVRETYRELRRIQHQMRLNNQGACRIEADRLDTAAVRTLWQGLLEQP